MAKFVSYVSSQNKWVRRAEPDLHWSHQCKTTKIQVVAHNNVDTLYLVATSDRIPTSLFSYNPLTNIWKTLVSTNTYYRQRWQMEKHYLSIRLVSLIVESRPTLYMIGRGADKIHVISYDIESNSWQQGNYLEDLGNTHGWGMLAHSTSLRATVIKKNGHAVIQITARADSSIKLLTYDPLTKQWSEQRGLGYNKFWGNSHRWWQQEQYYSTLRTTVITSLNSDNFMMLLDQLFPPQSETACTQDGVCEGTIEPVSTKFNSYSEIFAIKSEAWLQAITSYVANRPQKWLSLSYLEQDYLIQTSAASSNKHLPFWWPTVIMSQVLERFTHSLALITHMALSYFQGIFAP